MNKVSLSKKISFLLSKSLSRISGGKSFALRGICLMLTSKCNLSCKMCGFWGISGIGKNTEEILILDDYKQVVDDLELFKSNVIFSGGEPLIVPFWHELARYVRAKKLNVVLQTNGTFIKDNAEKIIECVNDLSVSIDGPEEIHDRIRGARGTYRLAVEGMMLVDDIKKRKKLLMPHIDINFTISDVNYSYLIDTVDELKKQNIDIRSITFMHLMFFNRNTFYEHKNKFQDKFNIGDVISGFLYSPENLDAGILSQQIKIIKRNYRNYPFDIIFAPEMRDIKIKRYYDMSYFPESAGNLQGKCFTPWLDAMLLPNGDLLNCMANVLGNVKKDRLRELWNNDRAKKWRKYINKFGYPKICKTCRFRYM